MKTNEPFLIAETAFHHEGDIQFLKKLIDAAVESGANAIKFHLLFDLDDYFIADHKAYDSLKSILITEEGWNEILDYCGQKCIDIIFLCNDVKAIKWVNSKVNPSIIAIEIHATGINDILLLDEAAKFDETVILYIGTSTLDEIKYAIDFLRRCAKTDIFLMHGFQSYPTSYKDVFLARMDALSTLFNLPIGYADHTDPSDPNNALISILGVANGYNILEKHFTLLPLEKKIDSQAAVSINTLKHIKALMLIAHDVRGQAVRLNMSDAETRAGNTGPMKKAIVAAKEIEAGKQLELSDIAFKRTNVSSSIKQKQLPELLGLRTKTAIKKDELIEFSKVEYLYVESDFSQFKPK